jgi:hypothetical protein
MTPEEIAKRNEKLVRRIGYYRAYPKPLIEQEFFSDCKDPGATSWKVLTGLAKEKPGKKPLIAYIHDKNGSPVSGLSFCALTEAGAKHLGLPRERAWPMEPGPINFNLAVGTYVFANRKNSCSRLESDQVGRVLGVTPPPPMLAHVIQAHHGSPTVLRVYVSSLEPAAAAKALGEIIDEARDPTTELAPLVDCGDYGFLLLMPTAPAAADARDYVRPLREVARVLVGVGPGSNEIVDYLKERRR